MKRSLIILLHIGYWLLYLVLIMLFALFMNAGMNRNAPDHLRHLFDFLKFIIALTLLPGVIGFYCAYFLLFDRFLSRQRISGLLLGGLVVIVVSGFCGVICTLALMKKFSFTTGDLWPTAQILIFMSLLALIHATIALIIRGFIKWYADIRIKEELRQRNFDTELALVRSQLSPHFLFNTINNIDVLILKDPVKASAYLNKLSDIMRFMLYETKTEQIGLQKELQYIDKYVALQKIRNANADFVRYDVDGDPGSWLIAPMLFIPFIENAFKHSGNKKANNGIVIKINISTAAIQFYCANRFTENALPAIEAGGLGNDLMEKRLQLLYPGRHKLITKKQADLYTVSLTIYTGEQHK